MKTLYITRVEAETLVAALQGHSLNDELTRYMIHCLLTYIANWEDDNLTVSPYESEQN